MDGNEYKESINMDCNEYRESINNGDDNKHRESINNGYDNKHRESINNGDDNKHREAINNGDDNKYREAINNGDVVLTENFLSFVEVIFQFIEKPTCRIAEAVQGAGRVCWMTEGGATIGEIGEAVDK
ncbi:unnamed protein product [Sphenostylis stenocarpa]|uniref:Uncharacterized protein n=1 Tax=Sphenostylis stenocarpa TaxID=92480 RepID=A0AA86V5N7_9FABA|nr:unnamed protein product [Sphenostylis stenocarpa]